MRKINKLFFCLLTVLIISSCNKNEEINPVNSETENNDAITQRNDALEKMALLVKDAVKNEEFRELIKQEATKQFDGDYDILYKRIARRQLKSSNNVSINNFFVKSISQKEQKSAKVAQANLEKMVNTIPDFQISVPVNCDKWDTKNFIPLVTYIPANFDEKTFTKIKAFDQNGNVVWLSLDKAPDFPVIVLGSCERIEENGKLKDMALPPDGGGGGGSGGGGGTGNTTRINGGMEYMQSMKFGNLSKIEKWVSGKPEIRLRVYYYHNNSLHTLLTDYFHPTRSSVDGNWKTYHTSLSNWYWNDYGTGLKFAWVEEDNLGPFSQKFIIAYAGVSLTFWIRSQDDKIGEKTVCKDDSKNQVYHLNANESNFYWKESY